MIDNNTRLQALKHYYLSQMNFKEHEWEQILPYLSFTDWKRNELIFSQGDYPKRMYFLVKGIARSFYTSLDGKEKNRTLFCDGSVLACMRTLISDESSSFGLQALTDCAAISIQYTDYNNLCINSPKWGLVYRTGLEAFVAYQERREASLLMYSARERYESFLNNYADYTDRIPLRHVALYLGISDVALSRIRREMGLIR